MTADAFADMLAANEAAAAHHVLGAPTGVARIGLAVLTCIDSRIDPLHMFGLKAGDAKFLRNAGARVTDDVERSLAAATAVLGVTRIAVVAHTGCKMAAVTEADVAREVAAAAGIAVTEAAAVDYLTVDDQAAVLRADVERLRACRLLRTGTVVGGFVLDLETGLLHPVG